MELSSHAEGVDPGIVSTAIRYVLRTDVVVPSPADGYAFVRRTLPDAAFLSLRCRYVQGPLFSDRRRGELAAVTDAQVAAMRAPRQVLPAAARVAVVAGAYSGLEGTVSRSVGDIVRVRIRLRSGVRRVSLRASQVRLVEA